ncbi:MAG: hypothetical protein IKA50_01485, partial [Clostridia bacterium]|nr:hypothetical protein [Clostridia bacterium]
SMTQISMLGATYNNSKKEVEVAYGEDQPVVTKDYKIVENDDGTISYVFVLKNGIKFSDGQPLTMEDVLFNYYVYLDPVYTGSNTLYSTKIQGLQAYRTQTPNAGSNSNNQIAKSAANAAETRLMELLNLYNGLMKNAADGTVTVEKMKEAIKTTNPSSGYKNAIYADPSKVSVETARDQLMEDYEHALALFKEELGSDYNTAKDSYTDEPYKSHSEFKDEIFRFMFHEGQVQVEYAKGADGKDDRTKIKKLTPMYDKNAIKTKEAAINFVYEVNVQESFNVVLTMWATSTKLINEYTGKATEVILNSKKKNGQLAVPNISGIVSLGHSDRAGETIKINDKSYKVATAHNADGTVKNSGEYDVLEITIEKVDPKAIWNFSLTIAPQHYYGKGAKTGVDIENNQFGVDYASFDFMQKVVQSSRNNKLPVGAGPYKVTDRKNSDKPAESAFFSNNVVYFKRNNNFKTVGSKLSNAKIEKLRYQVVPSSDAIANLEAGKVHYITPALTNDNFNKLDKLKSKGMVTLKTDQLGYGYIGVNASKVKDINLRKAIMCAMNTSLALDYYRAGTASQIYWPMSMVSWAYPDGADAKDNGRDYPAIGEFNEAAARDKIDAYMKNANVSAGDSKLKVQFTIAGSSLTDHPTYKVFRDASALLNSMGWETEVVCDAQALTKINTGSLAVWAAAWSSALDPDLYQVYHKDSTATSTLAWGYKHLNANGSAEEKRLLRELSTLIEDARSTNDQEDRADMYQEAMEKILDLAIELPVYQRSVLYAYNSKVIKTSTLPKDINPYSSPLDRIWEVEFVG